jgi:hypothetical protein
MTQDFSPQAADARRELEAKLPAGLNVDFDSFFPRLTGLGVKRQNNRRLDVLARVAPVLGGALEEGERVQWATEGTVNLWWEQMFMGAWAFLINRTAVVLTDKRLLLIHMSGKRPESFVNQVQRSAIRSVGGLFSITIALGRGKISLSGIPGHGKKGLKTLLPKNAGAAGGIEHLCSSCYAAHASHQETCDRCGTRFKSPKTAALRSMLLPGLGDFYLGHRGLAVLEMIGAVFTWLIAALLIAGSVEDESTMVGLIIALILVGFGHGLDGALTLAQGKKGMMALDGRLATRRKAAQPAAPAQPVVRSPLLQDATRR